ncbi:MAG: ABC transporter permease [Promethearchaeota archaeon]
MRKIYRAVIRDIYFNRSRSFITFLTIFIVIAFPIAMFSTAPSISKSLDDNSEEFHQAHLDIRFTGVNSDIIPLINESIQDSLGTAPERINSRILARYKILHEDQWYSVNIVGVNDSKKMDINEIKLVSGTLDISENETVILESFANHLNVTISDSISVYGENVHVFKIVGIIKSIEFMNYDFSQEGAIYITERDIRNLTNIPYPIYNNVLIYFSENVSTDEITKFSSDLKEIFIANHVPFVVLWQVREISISAALDDTLSLTSKYLNSSAIIIMIIAGLVIFIITKRYAFEQRKQTGMLYSFGYPSSTIMKSFLLRTFLIGITAIGVGIVASWYLLKIFCEKLASIWGILNLEYNFSMDVLYEVVSITLFATLLFTYLAAKENVSMTPYEAIRGKVKEFKGKIKKGIFFSIQPLQIKYSFRNLSRSKVRTFLTFFAFLSSIMLSFSLLATQTSLGKTQETYFNNNEKWDVKGIFNEFDDDDLNIFNNISNLDSMDYSEPYLEYIVQPDLQSELIVIMSGIIQDSKLINIDLQDGSGFSNGSAAECVLSIYIANRLECNVGDNFSFWFGTNQINVSVVGLCRDIGSPAAMFVQLPFLEKELLGKMPVNGILASANIGDSKDLINQMNTDQDIRYAISKQTYENKIGNMISVQTIIVKNMVLLGAIISFLTIFSTAFIIILERNREIALQRVFGFSKFQVLTQLGVEIGILTIISLIFGYIAGEFLNLYWLRLVSKDFFTVDNYFVYKDFVLIFGFTFLTIIISLLPEAQMLKHQNLANEIEEE